ncbi:MAG TPA: SDR family oxidoreductase [Casimicrobiaceae bacterium]|nr:SDR family oxidoreductase [Casimicrobiaceae bacterium]
MRDALSRDLAGKAVLVTGASTGIGAAVARAFAECGSRVAIHYNASRDAAEALAAEAGGGAFTIRGDFAAPGVAREVVANAAARMGRLDVLVNNAGGLVRRAPVAEVTDELFDAVLDLNVRSLVMACGAALPHLRAAGGGAIVNVTSIAARNGGGNGATMYAAAKGFVSTFTRGLAKEVVKDGIRVNAVSPGVIATPFHERYSTPAMLEGVRAQIPMARLGTADECVGAFLFLAAPSLSGYVTGQILEVNGGQYMP